MVYHALTTVRGLLLHLNNREASRSPRAPSLEADSTGILGQRDGPRACPKIERVRVTQLSSSYIDAI